MYIHEKVLAVRAVRYVKIQTPLGPMAVQHSITCLRVNTMSTLAIKIRIATNAGTSPTLFRAVSYGSTSGPVSRHFDLDPPLAHFVIPIDVIVRCEYVDKHNLTKYLPHVRNAISPESAFMATELLFQEVQREVDFRWPFGSMTNPGIIFGLHDGEDTYRRGPKGCDLNGTGKTRIGQVRSKWYFDADDPWEPDSDDDTD
ncbi:hypothetical protein OG21DRAFT_1607862 [Imleria badia]|nr:hypothetical protein OG21DRAFT_1607862 [Imleria badia]